MKERPILFSAPMVRALLEGRKTQTRRLVVPRTAADRQVFAELEPDERMIANGGDGSCLRGACDYLARRWGEPGDRLWVRETWGVGCRPCPFNGWRDGIEYRADQQMIADDEELPLWPATPPDGFEWDSVRGGWKPSIHMPRWASRINLRVTSVRVERLQAITEADACAEGVERHDDEGATYFGPLNCGHASAVFEFSRLWDSINGERASWESNPFVWVVGFERVEAST